MDWLTLADKGGAWALLLFGIGLLAAGKILFARELEPFKQAIANLQAAVKERDDRVQRLEAEARQLAIDTKNEMTRQVELSRGELSEMRKTVDTLTTQLLRGRE